MQTPKTMTEKRQSGSWVLWGPRADERPPSHFVPTTPMVPATLYNISNRGEPWVPTPFHRRVMEGLLGLLKPLCPQPRLLSVTYGFSLLGNNYRRGQPVYRYNLHLGYAPFMLDKAGKVNPIVPYFGDPYSGFGSFFINDIHIDVLSLFKMQDYLSITPQRLTKGGDVRPTGRIIAIPPRDDFAEQCKQWKQPIPEQLRLNNLPSEVERWQRIRFFGNHPDKMTCIVTNQVILTPGNRLPFIPVSIGTLLDILDTIKDEEAAYFKYSFETYTVKEESYQRQESVRKRADEIYQGNLTRLQEEKDVIALLRRLHASRLNQPAILNPEHAEFVTKGILENFAERAKKYRSFREPGQVFVENPREGVALVRLNREVFQNLRDGEVRCLSLMWSEHYRMPSNKSYGKPIQPEDPVPSSDSMGEKNLAEGMRTRLDWAKLRALVR